MFIVRKILIMLTYLVICNVFVPKIENGFSSANTNNQTIISNGILQGSKNTNIHYLFGKTITWRDSFEIEGKSITFDKQGNSYFTGTILTDFLVGTSDIFLGKLNSNGTLVWLNIYDYKTADVVYDLCLNEVTNLIYIVGSTINSSRVINTDFLIGCYDTISGIEIWNTTFGVENYSEIGYSIDFFENKLFITGTRTEYIEIDTNPDIILACFDSLTGIDIWVKNFATENYDYAPKLILDTTNEEMYFVFNSKNNKDTTENNQYSIKKLSLEGNQTWEINSLLSENIILNDFSIDTSNNLLVIVGEFTNFEVSNNKDTVIVSYDLTGNEKKRIFFGTKEFDEVGLTIAIDKSGNFIIAGYSTSDLFNKNVAFMTKIDSTGKVIWTGKMEKYLRSRVNNLAINDLGFIVTTGSAEGRHDYIFIRLLVGFTVDEDDDNLSTYFEVEIGTDPTLFDTDQDGFSDGQEFLHNTDPLNKYSNTTNRSILFNFGIAFTCIIIFLFLVVNFFIKKKGNDETSAIVKVYDKIISTFKRKRRIKHD